jgi:hypothetical protein
MPPWCVVIPRAGGRSDGDESSRACIRSTCHARLPSVGGRTRTYASLLLLSWLWSSICMWLTLAFLPQCISLWGSCRDISHRHRCARRTLIFSHWCEMSLHRVSLVKLWKKTSYLQVLKNMNLEGHVVDMVKNMHSKCKLQIQLQLKDTKLTNPLCQTHVTMLRLYVHVFHYVKHMSLL